MYKIIGYSNADAGVREYVVDTIEELNKLSGAMGSSAYCFEDKSFYLKAGNDEWRKI
jgi:hypothetical protein